MAIARATRNQTPCENVRTRRLDVVQAGGLALSSPQIVIEHADWAVA
jgi:hypothetical protein